MNVKRGIFSVSRVLVRLQDTVSVYLVSGLVIGQKYRDEPYDLSRSSRLSALQLRPLGICLKISTIVAKTSPSLYASRAGASM